MCGRILRAFVGRGLIEKADAKEMLGYQHSGFSVDAGVCIEAHDRAALERLLRCCARSPFAMDRLRKEGTALVYRCAPIGTGTLVCWHRIRRTGLRLRRWLHRPSKSWCRSGITL